VRREESPEGIMHLGEMGEEKPELKKNCLEDSLRGGSPRCTRRTREEYLRGAWGDCGRGRKRSGHLRGGYIHQSGATEGKPRGGKSWPFSLSDALVKERKIV